MPGSAAPLTYGRTGSGRQLVGDLDIDFLFGHSAEEMVGKHVSSVLVVCGCSRHDRSDLSDLWCVSPPAALPFHIPQVSGKVSSDAHSRSRSA
ncbi:hypothetical protein CA951_17040 [Rhodococcus sp. NCIMB 12038]|nr:hypothetical protein CA951_17040 [Rhodococcus sp. NCIMB 12038]